MSHPKITTTLAQLESEAQKQDNPLDNPRTFVAMFPSGPKIGKFLDPYLGVIQLNGIDGVIYSNQINAFKIPAMWVGKEEA